MQSYLKDTIVVAADKMCGQIPRRTSQILFMGGV